MLKTESRPDDVVFSLKIWLRRRLPPAATPGRTGRHLTGEVATACSVFGSATVSGRCQPRRRPKIGACSTDKTERDMDMPLFNILALSFPLRWNSWISPGLLFGPSSIGNPDCADRAGASRSTGPL